MYHKAILSALLVAGMLCLVSRADDQSPPQKSGKSDGATQTDQGMPGGMMGKGMMGKGMMGGAMMGKGMMGGPMMERGMKMMEMHQKMQADMQAMEAETDKLVAEMNQATGQKKIDAMAALLTKLVEQRKTMMGKMDAMHGDMMQMMMEGMGPGGPHDAAGADKNGPAHDHPVTGDGADHAQHTH